MSDRLSQQEVGHAAVMSTHQDASVMPAATAVGAAQSATTTTASHANMPTDASNFSNSSTPNHKRIKAQQTEMPAPKRRQTRLGQLGSGTHDAGAQRQYQPLQVHPDPNSSSNGMSHGQIEVGLFNSRGPCRHPGIGARDFPSAHQFEASAAIGFFHADMARVNVNFSIPASQSPFMDPQLDAARNVDSSTSTSPAQLRAAYLPLGPNATQEDVSITNILDAALTNRPRLNGGIRQLPKAIERSEFAAAAKLISSMARSSGSMASFEVGSTQNEALHMGTFLSDGQVLDPSSQVLDPSLTYGEAISTPVQSFGNIFQNVATSSTSRTLQEATDEEQSLAPSGRRMGQLHCGHPARVRKDLPEDLKLLVFSDCDSHWVDKGMGS